MERLSTNRGRFLKSALAAGAYLAAASGPGARLALAARVVLKDLKSREEVAALSERVVFNCTGLGAKALFGDQKLVPVRGQLEVLLPRPEVDYCYLGPNSLYMFPRRDGIVLGGSFEPDNQSLEPDAKTTARIIDGNAEIAKGLRH